MQRRQILSTLVSIAVFVFVSACGRADSPLPTPIPADAPLSGFARWRAADILGAFRDAGLRAEVIEPASKDERDGLATWMRVEAVRFRISATDEATGMILCFARPADLRWMQDYYQSLDGSSPQFRSRVFVMDNILLQINYQVPEPQASQYQAALHALTKQ